MSDIAYTSIPAVLFEPGQYIEFNDVLAASATATQPHRILVIGQKLAGSAAIGQIVTVADGPTAAVLFGTGSMLARMLAKHFSAQNTIPVDAVALAEGSAAATWTITLTGPATAAGELPIYIAGETCGIPITVGQTAAAAATALAAEISSIADLPVTAAANAAVVTLTARNLGLAGADIDVRSYYYSGDAVPAGITVAIASVLTGTSNPDITPAITAATGTWYDTIVMPFTDPANLATLATELASRWAPPRQSDARAYMAKRGSQGTLATFGLGQNVLSFCCIEATGPTTPYERAAILAGVIAASTAIDPARPVSTLQLVGDMAPAPAERFSWAQRNALLQDGVSTTKVDSGGNVMIDRAVTMYQTNAEGVADRAYLDITTPILLSYLRWSERNRIATKFPRYKLADNGTPIAPGQPIVTPKTVASELVALATEWQAAGLIDDVADYAARLVVQRNTTNRQRLDVLSSPTLVSGLLIYADQIQFQE